MTPVIGPLVLPFTVNAGAKSVMVYVPIAAVQFGAPGQSGVTYPFAYVAVSQ